MYGASFSSSTFFLSKLVFVQALNGLIVSITSLPQDMTLLSLPPAPLLQIVCGAMQRHPNAVWLSLAAKLIHQLDPPSLISLLAVPSEEAKSTVLVALPIILDSCLRFLRSEGAMEAVRAPCYNLPLYCAYMSSIESRYRTSIFWMPGDGCPAFCCAVFPITARSNGCAHAMLSASLDFTRALLTCCCLQILGS